MYNALHALRLHPSQRQRQPFIHRIVERLEEAHYRASIEEGAIDQVPLADQATLLRSLSGGVDGTKAGETTQELRQSVPVAEEAIDALNTWVRGDMAV